MSRGDKLYGWVKGSFSLVSVPGTTPTSVNVKQWNLKFVFVKKCHCFSFVGLMDPQKISISAYLLVSVPRPALYHSTGCIASPVRENKVWDCSQMKSF